MKQPNSAYFPRLAFGQMNFELKGATLPLLHAVTSFPKKQKAPLKFEQGFYLSRMQSGKDHRCRRVAMATATRQLDSADSEAAMFSMITFSV